EYRICTKYTQKQYKYTQNHTKTTQKHRKLHNILTKQPQFTQNTSKNTYILQISTKLHKNHNTQERNTQKLRNTHNTSPIYIYIHIHILQKKKIKHKKSFKKKKKNTIKFIQK